MSPFQPSGDLARWRVLYGLLRPLDVGHVLTYEAMAAALDLEPVKDRTTIQLAMRRAARELETEDGRAVDAVPNVGYRVARPPEQVDLARRHQRKAGRSLARGHSKVANIDYNGMDPDLRRVAEATAKILAAQMDFNRRMNVRASNLERAIEEVKGQASERAQRTEEELAALRERLARLEGSSGSE